MHNELYIWIYSFFIFNKLYFLIIINTLIWSWCLSTFETVLARSSVVQEQVIRNPIFGHLPALYCIISMWECTNHILVLFRVILTVAITCRASCFEPNASLLVHNMYLQVFFANNPSPNKALHIKSYNFRSSIRSTLRCLFFVPVVIV